MLSHDSRSRAAPSRREQRIAGSFPRSGRSGFPYPRTSGRHLGIRFFEAVESRPFRREVYNREVRRQGNLRKVLMVLLALAGASSDAMALRFSLGAMACCAKTHNECAGLRTPDNCCQRMGHGIGPSASTAPTARASLFGLTLAVMPALAAPTAVESVRFLPDPAFKRPHDPPHLHPVPLLI